MQIGKAKSGNSWIYNILRSILKKRDLWQESYIKQQEIYKKAKTWDLSQEDQASHDVIDITNEGCYYRISSVFREEVTDLSQYMEVATLVWTHSPYSDYTPTVLQHCDKAVYMCRDPRDVALSMARFQLTPYMKKYYPNSYESVDHWMKVKYEQKLRAWCRHVGPYLARSEELDLCWVFYEQLKHDFRAVVRRLSEHLEVGLSEGEIEEIQEETSLKSMKKKHPNHVQKGKERQWVEKLTDKQVEAAGSVAGPMLDLLGYPKRRNVDGLPSFPDELSREEVYAALDQASPSFFDKVRGKLKRMVFK